jgi:nicotinamidase-related amidase
MSPYVPEVVPEADRRFFETGENAAEAGWGETPAVLVVDLTEAFVEERPAVGQPCVEETAQLLGTARENDIPVFHAIPSERGQYPEDYPKPTITPDRAPSPERREWLDSLTEIPPAVQPTADEPVLSRPRASAFFDTHLANRFHHEGIDTVVVAGMTTSGCVRATVVDGHSSNFRMIVPTTCVADRSVVSHEVSLFDMDQKYADVLDRETVCDRLAEGSAGGE